MARELAVKVIVDSDEAKRKLADFDRQTDTTKAKLSGSTGSVDQVTGALGRLGAASVSAGTLIKGLAGLTLAGTLIDSVVGFGVALLEDADALTKLSDKTGVGVVALQRLRAVAEESGNSLDQITSAITQFQNRVTDGNRDALASMQSLGLSFETLKQQSPDEQFVTIAKAVALIPDPMERTNAAMALFGRTGAEILPSIRADIDEIVKQTETLDAETIALLDSAGDAWDRFARRVKVALARVVLPETEASIERLKKMSEIADGVRLPDLPAGIAPSVNDPLRALGLPSSVEMLKLEADMDRIVQKTKEQEKAARQAATEHKKFVDSVRSLTTDAIGARPGAGAIGVLPAASTGRVEAFANVLRGLNEDGTLIANALPVVADKLQEVGRAGGLAQKDLERLRGEFTAGSGAFRAFGEGLSKVVIGAIQGGGNVIASAASFVGQQIGSTLSGSLSKSLSGASGLGKVVGQALAGALPVVGALLGPAISGLVGFFTKKEGRAVNDMRDEFQRLNFGSLAQMDQAFHRVGLTVDRVLDARTVKDYEAAIAEFNQRLNAQQSAMRELDQIAEKYGLTLQDLGPAWQKNRLDEQAQQLFKDFELLVGAGANQEAVLQKMSKSLNDYLQKAVSLGIEVPSSMKPIIEQMIALGLLTDASGKKIESLEGSGISFAETLTQGFTRVADSIKEMVELLRLFLGLTSQIPGAKANYVPPVAPPGGEDVQGYHRGGVVVPYVAKAHRGMYIGRLQSDEVPIVALKGEGVVSRSGMQALGGPSALGALNTGAPNPQDWNPGSFARRRTGEDELPTFIPWARDRWQSMQARQNPVVVDARGAYFNRSTARELARDVADHMRTDGPARTRMVGALGRR